jgi:carbonic anhydrase
MEFFSDQVIRDLLANSLETAALGPDGFHDVGTGPGSAEAAYVDWLTIADRDQSVVDDVTRIRNHPLVPGSIPIYGYIYEVTTGRLVEVTEATKAGVPT